MTLKQTLVGVFVGLAGIAIGATTGLIQDGKLFTNPQDSVVVVDAQVEVPQQDNLLEIFFGGKRASEGPKQMKIEHWYGTGFFVTGHRLITARHVVTPSEGEGRLVKITIVNKFGKRAEATVVQENKAYDLVELDTDLPAPVLQVASTPSQRGSSVTEIGHPGLIRYVVSVGTIVGFDREQGYTIASLDTFHGNSGGPILNSSGQVVGVCHTTLDSTRFTGIGTLRQLRDFLYPDEIR